MNEKNRMKSHSTRPLRSIIAALWITLHGAVSGQVTSGTADSNAAAAAPSNSDRLERLEETVRLLLIQNAELKKQVQALQDKTMVAAPSESEHSATVPIEPKTSQAAETGAKSETASRPASPTDVKFFWKNGLGFESADGKTLKGKLGGRIQYDLAAFDQDAALKEIAGNAAPAAEFRRVRLYTSGGLDLGARVFYKSQIDFAGSNFKFADAYVGLKDIPYLGVLQLGQRYEPFSLEQLTSDNYITFLERASPIEAFSPGRNVGALVRNDLFDGRATWAFGVFADDKNDRGDGDSFESNTHLSGRITALPWMDDTSGESRYWHVGAGGAVIDPEDDTVRFRSRPEAHLAPRYVDTKAFAATDVYLSNIESALTLGPFAVQAEYFRAWVNAAAISNPSFDGLYVFGSWFLTGEHRPYSASEGIIGRVKPLKNFSFGGGPGAVELALRYSRLNLTDESIAGGRLADYSAALNWYLNPNARVMLNYIFSDLDRRSEDPEGHSVQARFQVDF